MRLIFSIVIVFGLSSCDGSFIYGEDYNISADGWHKDSTLTFTTDSLTDLPSVITIGLNLRNTKAYSYRNLYLFVEIDIPGKDQPIKDTIDHILMTADGYWSEGVQGGDIKESIVYYPYAIQNPPKGVYTIKVQQGMREQFLKEVISVGTRIQKLDR